MRKILSVLVAALAVCPALAHADLIGTTVAGDFNVPGAHQQISLIPPWNWTQEAMGTTLVPML